MTDAEIDKLVKIANHKQFKMSDYHGRALAKTARLLCEALNAVPPYAVETCAAIAGACQHLSVEASRHFDAVYGGEQ
jgi:hypothetical protein